MKQISVITTICTFLLIGVGIPLQALNGEDDNIYIAVEEMPEYPGGDKEMIKFIEKNIQYPEEAIENGIEGQVELKFVIEKDGSISNIKVIRKLDENLDKEAARIVSKMPDWKPGKQRGKNVRVSYTLPITFRLSTEDN